MLKKVLLAFAGIAVLAAVAPVAQAESDLDFTLVNATGYGITAIHVAPTKSKDWGDSIITETLEDGESVDITFHPKATTGKWDILVSWEDGSPDVYWTGYDLTTINKITLKYDRKADKTSAITE